MYILYYTRKPALVPYCAVFLYEDKRSIYVLCQDCCIIECTYLHLYKKVKKKRQYLHNCLRVHGNWILEKKIENKVQKVTYNEEHVFETGMGLKSVHASLTFHYWICYFLLEQYVKNTLSSHLLTLEWIKSWGLFQCIKWQNCIQRRCWLPWQNHF